MSYYSDAKVAAYASAAAGNASAALASAGVDVVNVTNSGTITITANHDEATLAFRLANVRAFEVLSVAYPADQVRYDLMDELAKLIVGESSTFLP